MAAQHHNIVALLLLSAACNVGHPLVGTKKFMDGDLHLLCGKPPACDGPSGQDATPDHPSLALVGCATPELCRKDDDQFELVACPQEKLETLPLSARCQALEFQAEKGQADLNLEGIEWNEVNLTFRSEQPITVVMSGGTLSRVHMQLEGPVAVRIENLDTLDDLRIDGAANSGGKPSVSLDSLRGQNLSVGSPDQPFAGSINMHALGLDDIDLRAENSTFESVLLQDASLRIDSLNFTDVTLNHTLLESSQALVSAYTVADSVLRFCGDEVRLIDGDITRTELSSCMDHTTRIYTCMFNSGLIDGDFELADVSISVGRIASKSATRIVGYNTHLFIAQLCDNIEQLALGYASDVRCSNCYDGVTEDQPLCVVERLKDVFSSNYCHAWANETSPPLCGGDLPKLPDRLR